MKEKIEIDFPPRFAARWGYERDTPHHITEIFRARHSEQAAFIALMGEYSDNFCEIPHKAINDIDPCWKQNWFPPLDGASAYSVVAGYRPKLVIEIGSGNSTKFFCRAKRDHSLDTKIWSIDPHPRTEIDQLCDHVFRAGVEDVDIDIVDALQPGDVLFFDGSHRSFQNSDVSVFFIDLLPRLADGVTVGLHDIFWPFDYPQHWVDRYYNEQYLLAAYMLAFGTQFPLIFSSSYVWRNMGSQLESAFSPEARHHMPRLAGGCLWFTKRTVGSLV